MWQRKIFTPAMWEYAIGNSTDCGFHGAQFYPQCEAFFVRSQLSLWCIEWNGTVLWPPRSPILALIDIYKWRALFAADNTRDKFCRLTEAAAVTVWLMLWSFQPPGNSCWRRYHLCIQTGGQHFQQLLLTFYESYEAVVMKCVKTIKYVRFYIRSC